MSSVRVGACHRQLSLRIMPRSRLADSADNLSPFESVPDDVLGNITRRLELTDLVALERVSKTFGDRVCHQLQYLWASDDLCADC